MEQVAILDTEVSRATYDLLVDGINRAIESREQLHVVTANAAMLVTALQDPDLARCLKQADVVTADGMSVIWAAKLQGTPLQERVTGIDALRRILASAEKKGHRVFFLGASREVIQLAAMKMGQEFPDLKLAGFRDGYFTDDRLVIQMINECDPDILFVGMGFGLQEKWLMRHRHALRARVLMGIGGSFDVLAGKVNRAPLWMQRWGLEWFFRLWQEPGRLWRRYLRTNSLFIWEVIKRKFRGSKGGGG